MFEEVEAQLVLHATLRIVVWTMYHVTQVIDEQLKVPLGISPEADSHQAWRVGREIGLFTANLHIKLWHTATESYYYHTTST